MTSGRAAYCLAILVIALAQAAFAQTAEKAYRIGWIGYTTPSRPEQRASHDTFRDSLRDQGFVEGRNLTIERRYVDGVTERNVQFAAEFVAMKVDVIVAEASVAARAAKEATRTIPIVMFFVTDPVRIGLVTSLARPGGNVTGMSNMLADLGAKTFQLMKEAVPHASRVGTFWNPDNPGSALGMKATLEFEAREAQSQSKSGLGLTTVPLAVRTAADLDAAFEQALRERVDVLVPHLTALPFYPRIAEFAAKHRLPVVAALRSTVEQGALLSVGIDSREQFRGAAVYVAKILKGASPADLPVEQPIEVAIYVNLKTARALGLTIPQTILLRADGVIE